MGHMGSLTLNQLLRIEEDLGDEAVFPGWSAFPRAATDAVLIQHKLRVAGTCVAALGFQARRCDMSVTRSPS